jgi:hypothetical protein
MNIANFQLVLNHIKAHPETWDQREWHCDTTHCFAGHAQILAGKPIDDLAHHDAMEFLDLTIEQAHYLFYKAKRIEDFERFLADAISYTEKA